MSWIEKYASSSVDLLDSLEECQDEQCLVEKLDAAGISHRNVSIPEIDAELIVFSIGKEPYVFYRDDPYLESADTFLLRVMSNSSKVSAYYEKNFPSVWKMDFSDYGDNYGYHATGTSKLDSILEKGLTPRDETRGINNRKTGSAVFISMGNEYLAESYGPVVLRIDIPAMKADKYLPPASLEIPVQEKLVADKLSGILGLPEGMYPQESGIEDNTVVVYGTIPPKYISVVKSGARRASADNKIVSEAAGQEEESRPDIKAFSREGGGFFIFLVDIVYPDRKYTVHWMNKAPYKGPVSGSAKDLYYAIKGAGIDVAKVGGVRIDEEAVAEIMGKKKTTPGKVNVSEAVVAPPPPELKDDDQPDLPGMSWDSKKPKKGGHFSSTIGEVKTSGSVWTKGQVYCGKDGCYDVGLLQDATANNEVIPVKVSKISSKLKDNAWGTDDTPLSPFNVMSNPTFSESHMKHMAKIRTADLSKPVIIRAKTWELLDGNHRLARCVYEGRERILAVFAQEEQMNESKLEV